MATRQDSASREARPLTLTEQARRIQLIEVTIDLIADKGYPRASLAGIAERAGITKAAVLYHFPSKDALVRAAYEQVLGALVQDVATAVEAASPGDGPTAYIRSMITHLHDHPRHIRMIIEAMTHEAGTDHEPAARWRPLADIIAAAHGARGSVTDDARTTAIIIGGAIDAIVAEHLKDPGYDTRGAGEHLIRMIESTLEP